MFYVSKYIGIYGGVKTYSRLQESMVSQSSGMVYVVCVPCLVLKTSHADEGHGLLSVT